MSVKYLIRDVRGLNKERIKLNLEMKQDVQTLYATLELTAEELFNIAMQRTKKNPAPEDQSETRGKTSD